MTLIYVRTYMSAHICLLIYAHSYMTAHICAHMTTAGDFDLKLDGVEY